MQRADGMIYAPRGKPNPVVGPDEFIVAAIGLDHGHIYGMCNGLIEAGANSGLGIRSRPGQGSGFSGGIPADYDRAQRGAHSR